MAYTTGTAPSNANCAAAFMTLLDPLLIAAGFTFIETWTNATITAMVYKSPAASNVQNADWYLCTYRTVDTATVVNFIAAEVWDGTTKKFRNYCPASTSAPVAVTFAVNDAVGVLPNSASLYKSALTITTAAFPYFVSANPNRVYVATKVSATDDGVYVGLYDDLLPVAISPFPLLNIDTNAFQSYGIGAFSREPNTTTSVTNGFGAGAWLQWIGAGGASYWLPSSAGADIYQGRQLPGRAIIYSARITTMPSQNPANGARGLLKDSVWIGGTQGDTMAVLDAASVTKNYACFIGMGIWVDVAV